MKLTATSTAAAQGAVVLLLLWGTTEKLLFAQSAPPAPPAAADAKAEPASAASPTPAKVDVAPAASDSDIASRLQRILTATGWFTQPEVRVDQGVVFLRGATDSADYKQWAGNLATKTEDVVAVVNQIELTERSAWDFRPAEMEVRKLWRNLIQSLPMLALAAIALAVTFLAAAGVSRLTDRVLKQRMSNTLLRQVAARAVIIPVGLIGVYLVLRISGLTQMAVTVIGGTGLLGLILGIAFQNIAENFLASILISIQRPFEAGDLVEVGGFEGYVQRLTTRGTILLTLDGNHVQVPNSIIYKSVIRNYTANPNTRVDFRAGLNYDQAISKAQAAALGVLQEHPAVLKDPEPSVLVEELADDKVYLRIYFWVDTKQNSRQKVRSSLMRLIKTTFRCTDLSVAAESPADDEAPPREQPTRAAIATPDGRGESKEVSVRAEGRLTSEKVEIERQAKQGRQVESGPDLLRAGAATSAAKSALT